MKKNIFFAFFLFFVFNLFPMDWPSTGRIVQNFGLNDRGMPILGASFEGTGPVNASDNGELLYIRREGDIASRLPSPLGSWLAIDHGEGIISIYSRFNLSTDFTIPNRVSRGMTLGNSGLTGWSNQSGVYFQLFDRRERRWINPSLIVSSPDTRAPLIHSVYLRNPEGSLINPSQTSVISQGLYVIIINTDDTRTNVNDVPLAPFRITCIVNGSEAGSLSFQTYSARDGTLLVNRNGLSPVRQVYARAPAYEAAEIWFSRGQTTLEIIVQDIAGNTRNVSYRLMIE